MNVMHCVTSIYSRRRFAVLFFSLLITMVAAPVMSAMGISTQFMEVFLTLNILSAVLITLFRFGAHVGLGLMALFFAARSGYALLGYEPLLASSQTISAMICILAAGIMFRFVLSEGVVTSERIYAALNLYLLLGVMCGMLFCFFEELWPGSLVFQGSALTGSKRNLLAHTIYFSFVTLGTLGYGDVIPVSGPARALAVTESIIGQMYLVVVVARIVGLYKSRSERNEHNERNEARPADRPTLS